MARIKFPIFSVGVAYPGKRPEDHKHEEKEVGFWDADQAEEAAQKYLRTAPIVAVLRNGFPVRAWDFAGKRTV